jgi:hypothetical protein
MRAGNTGAKAGDDVVQIYILIALPFVWLAFIILGSILMPKYWRKVLAAYEIIDTIDPDIKRAVNWFDDGSPLGPAFLSMKRSVRVWPHLHRLALYGAPAPEMVSGDIIEAANLLRRVVLPRLIFAILVGTLTTTFLLVKGAYFWALIPILPLLIYIPLRWPSTDEIKERIARQSQSA